MNKQNETILEVFCMLNGLNNDVYQIISSYKDELIKWKEDLLNAFIEKVKNENFNKEDIKEAEKLETTLVNWYEDIISGNTGKDFWERQSKVGLEYLANGVKLDFLISMMSFLQNKFAEKAFSIYETQEALKIYQAFKTITDAVLAVIVSGHLDIYIKSIETMSGIKRPVLERMASLECKKILERG